MRRLIFLLLVALCPLFLASAFASDINLDKIKLPPGFHISIYTDKVPGARSMTLGDYPGAIYRIIYKK